MIESPKEFFTKAVSRSGSYNQSALCEKLTVSTAAYSQWKQGVSFPSDTTMTHLANLCHFDEDLALAHLNFWRCKDAARAPYRRILEQVMKAKGIAATALFGTMIAANSLPPLDFSGECRIATSKLMIMRNNA